MFTLIFTKVFQASGTGKNGRPYTRWDYKTADDQRYVHFAGTQEIPLNVPIIVQVEGDSKIGAWKAVGTDLPAGNPQTSFAPVEGPNGASAVPVTVQGHTSRDLQIHRQTAAKVAAKLLDFFPPEEQELETFFQVAERLVDYFSNGVRDEVPF